MRIESWVRKTGLAGLLALFLAGCGEEEVCNIPELMFEQLTGEDTIEFNRTTAAERISQRFTAPQSFELFEVGFFIRKVEGTPGTLLGTLNFAIHRDDNGEPNDTPIAAGGPIPVSAAAIGTVMDGVFIDFINQLELDGGADYHFVVTYSQPPDANNYFEIGINTGPDAYPLGEISRFDTNLSPDEWVTEGTDDMEFFVTGCVPD
jgi:hypothetical protein